MRVTALALFALTACGRLGFEVAGSDSAPGASYASLVLADGPRAYYRLGETAGPRAVDATGNGNHGTYQVNGGTLGFEVPGALTRDSDTSVKMDGTYLLPAQVAIATSATWAGDFTVEMFVQPLATPPTPYPYLLFLCESYQVNGFRLGWDPQVRLHMWTTEAGATGNLISTQAMTSLAWNHVALVKEGATFSIYRDAELIASDVVDYIPTTPGTSNCGFGAFHGMSTTAGFDEVAIYERALSQATLAAHFAAR